MYKSSSSTQNSDFNTLSWLFNYFTPSRSSTYRTEFFAYEISYTRGPVQQTAFKLRVGGVGVGVKWLNSYGNTPSGIF